ncbi:MAG: hypothetical protein K0R01_3273 [Mycobacterium sp.]|nr:hypothetical protein [Mycobacterium sp.]
MCRRSDDADRAGAEAATRLRRVRYVPRSHDSSYDVTASGTGSLAVGARTAPARVEDCRDDRSVYSVVSGSVILKLVQRERNSTGRFGIVRTYPRRVKRLTPVLAVMVGVTMILALFLLRHSDCNDEQPRPAWARCGSPQTSYRREPR